MSLSFIFDRDSVYQTKTFHLNSPCMTTRAGSKAPVQLNVCGNVCTLYVDGMTTRTISNFTELVDSDGLATIGEYLPKEFDSEQQRNTTDNTGVVGCRLCGGSDAHLWRLQKRDPALRTAEQAAPGDISKLEWRKVIISFSWRGFPRVCTYHQHAHRDPT